MKPVHYVLFFISLLPQFLLRDFTPDNELRYLSIADENLGLGRFFAFMHHGEYYSDKPPLYLWLVMLCKSIFGRHSLVALSIFSVLPSLLIIQIMDQWTKRELSVADRATAGLALFTAVFFIGSSIVLRMDMLMCLFITYALYIFYRMYTKDIAPKKGQVLFGLSIFLAVFTKGPMGIIVPLISSISFLLATGKLRDIGKYWHWRAILILLVLCGAWFLGVWLEGGKSYLYGLLVHQTVDRAVDSFHHKAPFYYYGISIWYALAPWSLFMLSVIVARLRAKERPSNLAVFFGLSSLSTLLFLSMVSSKIVIYLLPVFPFAVYYSFLVQSKLNENIFTRITLACPALIFMLALPAVLMLRDSIPALELRSPWLIGAILPLTAAGSYSLYLLARKRHYTLTIRTLGFGLLATICIAGLSISQFNSLIGYGNMAAAGKTLAAESAAPAYFSWEIRRPENMDVYLSAPVMEISQENLLNGAYRGGVLFVDREKLIQQPALNNYLGRFKKIEVGKYAAILLSQ
ncbi:ArnT family glycosyltransferase [Sphingobacterium griseoflavum]|uniref:Dolichyl-phosphate-mannose--protein mannosyltransferase n=1 Tax=Sphingobacterium griseoflavum TaxID=1474952 RepID=A0ABQ3HYB3_9SPHI|nr:glycosyltransferase family 39 protein [Sphingobacterium griseoflavum]GHE39647.1 dolichyl-phosphate-mannose--protein mannosyltransferase [Sphingobacterium griseoflavum]